MAQETQHDWRDGQSHGRMSALTPQTHETGLIGTADYSRKRVRHHDT